MFSRILIANRGEIALRIIRAAREMGIESVAVYSQADREGAWVSAADRAMCIGPAPAGASYLNIPSIVAAAEVANVDAIHPGYGFLAENAHFAEICRSCKIEFIGPSAESMQLLGDKVECKKLAASNNVPTFPGSKGRVDDEDEALKVAERIGYPVIVKAAAGGGGRGMRIAHNDIALRSGLHSARAEADAAFGDPGVYIEKYLEHARHVEVQILGDKHGRIVHLFERDCTMQRRHQKLIEEAPCSVIDSKTRSKLCDAAVRMARGAGYYGAGTVEFLLDPAGGAYYLLEVNTRVQVEHPVTEQVTGIDIVGQTFRIAAGEKLGLSQSDISLRGHAIECRINAEDPDRDFAPQPGRLDAFMPPGGPGVRMDTHAHAGYTIPPNYDSLIAKLIVHADDREAARLRMQRALAEFRVSPIATTIGLHRRLLNNSHFVNNDFDIHFVERLLAK
jgi:acetyl-CoA carboxylase biotin carboxylase subunit